MWKKAPYAIKCSSGSYPCMLCQIPAKALFSLKGLCNEMTQPRTGHFDHTYRYAGLKNGYPLFRSGHNLRFFLWLAFFIKFSTIFFQGQDAQSNVF